MVLSSKLIIYREEADTIPFAGYYIICKTSQYTLDDGFIMHMTRLKITANFLM